MTLAAPAADTFSKLCPQSFAGLALSRPQVTALVHPEVTALFPSILVVQATAFADNAPSISISCATSTIFAVSFV